VAKKVKTERSESPALVSKETPTIERPKRTSRKSVSYAEVVSDPEMEEELENKDSIETSKPVKVEKTSIKKINEEEEEGRETKTIKLEKKVIKKQIKEEEEEEPEPVKAPKKN